MLLLRQVWKGPIRISKCASLHRWMLKDLISVNLVNRKAEGGI